MNTPTTSSTPSAFHPGVGPGLAFAASEFPEADVSRLMLAITEEIERGLYTPVELARDVEHLFAAEGPEELCKVLREGVARTLAMAVLGKPVVGTWLALALNSTVRDERIAKRTARLRARAAAARAEIAARATCAA